MPPQQRITTFERPAHGLRANTDCGRASVALRWLHGNGSDRDSLVGYNQPRRRGGVDLLLPLASQTLYVAASGVPDATPLVRRTCCRLGDQQQGLECDGTFREGVAGLAVDEALCVVVEHADSEERLLYSISRRGRLHTDFVITDPRQRNSFCIIRPAKKADECSRNSQCGKIVI